MSLETDLLNYKSWLQVEGIVPDRMLAYNGELRKLQETLNFGKVVHSSFLGMPRSSSKSYLLFIEAVKDRNTHYANEPFKIAKIFLGREYLIVNVIDSKEKEYTLDGIFYKTVKPISTLKDILDILKRYKMHPIKVSDVILGTYKPVFQIEPDIQMEGIPEKTLNQLTPMMIDFGFEIKKNGFTYQDEQFIVGIYGLTTRYKSVIISVLDESDTNYIHWSVKWKNDKESKQGMTEFLSGLLGRIKEWNE